RVAGGTTRGGATGAADSDEDLWYPGSGCRGVTRSFSVDEYQRILRTSAGAADRPRSFGESRFYDVRCLLRCRLSEDPCNRHGLARWVLANEPEARAEHGHCAAHRCDTPYSFSGSPYPKPF